MSEHEMLGLSVFSTKKAEVEAWLVEYAFISPPDFEFLKGDHSAVLFGGSGTGKTASCMALEHYGRTKAKKLIVNWRPQVAEIHVEPSTSLALSQLKEILSSCAKTILEYCVIDSSILINSPASSQEFLIWFLRTFLGKKQFIDLIPDTMTSKEKKLFQELGTRYSQDLFEDENEVMAIATEFGKAVKSAGYTAVWILVDGIEWFNENQRIYAVNSLRSMLSTLKIFEIPYFSYKMILPIELESELITAIGILRDRVMVFRIAWDIRYLSRILEKRLSIALGKLTLFDDIYKSEEILSWLESCGGTTPRGWLEYFRPIFSTYWDIVANEPPRKLTKDEWASARKRSSLHLNFDKETNQVSIGMAPSKILSPEVGAIFSYLHQNQGKFCTKRELYYRAYVPFVTPQEKIAQVEEQLAWPKEYDDLINTVIYRIRQIVEPNPKDKEPVFVTTKRDVGVRLSLQAFQ